jgi:hypothetical protein
MPVSVIKAPSESPPNNQAGQIDDGQEILNVVRQLYAKIDAYKNKYNQLRDVCIQLRKEKQDYVTKNDITEQRLHQALQEKAEAGARCGELQQRCLGLENENRELQQRYQALQTLEEEYRALKEENKKLNLGNVSNQVVADKDDLELIAKFNNWASYPQSRLDAMQFKYVSGEIKIRQPQPLAESSNETRWIVNRTGKKHYIFPNPCFFDEMTDISEFYKINGGLRPKGQNKLKIMKPCEISETGFIEYPGELELLK